MVVGLGAAVSNGCNKFSLRKLFCRILKAITAEPVLVLFLLPYFISSIAIQNLSLEKSCRVNLKLNTSLCDAIQQRNRSGYREMDEVIVGKLIATVSIWRQVVSSILSALLLPLLGSWSDRNKTRKVLILLPIIGEIISNIGFILCTFFFYELPMEVTVIVGVLPIALTGGFHIMLLGVFAYISSVSSREDRTFRIGIAHVLLFMSIAIGTTISGVIYKLIGFYGVFSLSLSMYTLGGFYAYFKLEEDKGVGERSLTNCELLKDVLNIKETVSNFKFIVESNSKVQTRQMLAILVVATLTTGPFYGQNAVLYLYTRLQFNWNEIDFSIFDGYFSVIHTTGNCCVLAIFSKWLQYDDAILGAVASVSKICAGIAYMMANTVLWFYISALLEIPVAVAIIASQSIITKLVLEKDLGKITSLFGIAESIGSLICVPMYSAIFKTTIDTFPRLFYVAGISLSVPALLLFMWFYRKRNARYPAEV